MQVIIDVDSIYRGEMGSIIGEVCLQIDDIAYPQYAWTDFIVVILCWWAEAATILHYSDGKSSLDLLFMRGPYFVKLNRLDDDTAQARFMRRGQQHTTTDHEQVIDTHLFIQSLKKAIKQVINKCQREGWQGNDAAALEGRLKALSNLNLP